MHAGRNINEYKHFKTEQLVLSIYVPKYKWSDLKEYIFHYFTHIKFKNSIQCQNRNCPWGE